MRESKKQKAERIKAALAALKEAYPDAKPELNFTSPFELLVATMLSAQCTDKQVNKATAVLFPLYNTPEAFASLSEEELAPYIRSCGFYQTKGKNIIAASKIIVEQYGGEVPRERDELTKLPGVGRKTANVVVSNAFGVPAIAVDTHVFRVANRIGLADESVEVFPVSAATVTGFDALIDCLVRTLATLPKTYQFEEEEINIGHKYEPGFNIERDGDVFVVTGGSVDYILDTTYADDEGSMRRFQQYLIKEGIIDALRAAGANEESVVRMGEWEFDFVE